MQDRLQIGKIVRAQGIRGELKVEHSMDDPAQIHALQALYLGQESAPRKLLAARVAQNFLYITLEGIADRTEAERYAQTPISVERAQLPPLGEDRYYLADLIGCEVVTETGEAIGVLQDVLQAAGNDVYVIRGKRTLLLPALKLVIRDIDIQAKRVTVDSTRIAQVGLYED